MSLGEKIKRIRKEFSLSQENLADILNVSRQAITKWENDLGLPDTENLQNLAKTFSITIDYLLNSEDLPALVMRIDLEKDDYKNKIDTYEKVLKKYYPKPWIIYTVTRVKKMSKLEATFDFLIGSGTVQLADALNDLSPYYIVQKDELYLLVNIKDYVLEVKQINNIKNKKFEVNGNTFKIHQQVKFKNN